MAPESQGQVIRTTMTALQTNTGSLSANGLSTDGAAQYRKIANPHADVHPGDRPQIFILHFGNKMFGWKWGGPILSNLL